MTPLIRQFLTEWLAWVEAGAGEHSIFDRCEGLCLTIYNYAERHADPEVAKRPHRAEDDLREVFVASGIDPYYPFGNRSYSMRARYGSQHRCPARLAWVRAQLEGVPSHEPWSQ